MNTLKIAQEWLEESEPATRAMVKTLIEEVKLRADYDAERKWRKEYKPTNWDKFIQFLEVAFGVLGSIALIVFFISFIIIN